eukprot:GILK01002386.1.p1 GENE.GILK01002386.1~~GILK01002386.1.p1  ORF type:complete len:577 (-),score=89.61 GILK01002386.1:135-1865(-)
MGRSVFACLLFVCSFALAVAYHQGDNVPVLVNKVGPYANPTETYRYYSLPFCQPFTIENDQNTWGQILTGDRKAHSLYKLQFKTNNDWTALCTLSLNEDDLDKFRVAVEEDYFYEMFVDGLPVLDYIGDKIIDPAKDNSTRYFLRTHVSFNIGYNQNDVVIANVSYDPDLRVDITDAKDLRVQFSYTVKWSPSDVPFESRMDVYTWNAFAAHAYEIHWLSIVNSFVLVLLLTAFLAIILMRVVKTEFSRGEDDIMGDETGWKLLHGDVFRYPPHKSLFCSILGAGSQLVVLVFSLVSLRTVGFYYGTRGALVTGAIVCYALTAGIAGYVSGAIYKKMGGTGWAWNIVLTACLFPGFLFAVWAFLNTVALTYSSTAALPFSTIVLIVLLWALVTFPLTVVGGIAGRNQAVTFEVPCRPTKIPREIPLMPWYRRGPTQVFLAGFLPFSAICLELHYIFSSVWGHKIYTLYGILMLAFIMLIIVTACVTVALTYFQLNAEDHKWWWRSLFSGGSTGLFIYAYCFFYYFERSEMFGFLQTSFFFGYMLVVGFAFFLMMGAVGFFSSFVFVRYIYDAIKSD